jgi:hypothetical protein
MKYTKECVNGNEKGEENYGGLELDCWEEQRRASES